MSWVKQSLMRRRQIMILSSSPCMFMELCGYKKRVGRLSSQSLGLTTRIRAVAVGPHDGPQTV